MCEQCEVLREENRQLRDMLFGSEYEKIDDAMCFLTARQQMLYRLLLRSPVADRYRLQSALSFASRKGDELEDPEELVRVQIHHMRRRLAPLGIKIETIWGVGYRLIREAA